MAAYIQESIDNPKINKLRELESTLKFLLDKVARLTQEQTELKQRIEQLEKKNK